MAWRWLAPVTLFLLAACLFSYLRLPAASQSRISPNNITAIDFRIWVDVGPGQQPIPKTTTNKARIDEFLHAMDDSVPTSDHKCAGRAVVFLKSAAREYKVEVLPGPNELFYEFRYEGKIYKVDRRRFSKALEEIGIAPVPLE